MPASTQASRNLIRERRRARLRQMPPIVELSMRLPSGRPWAFNVLSEMGNCSPCMEAIASNFDALFILLEKALEAKGASKRSTRKAPRSPRGETGAREYWVGSKRRWLQVSYPESEVDGRKRKRTLARRSSDESGFEPTKPTRALLPLASSRQSLEEVVESPDSESVEHVGRKSACLHEASGLGVLGA